MLTASVGSCGRGRKLTSRNKTIITRSIIRERLDHITTRDISIFVNPLDFGVFAAWVKDCESRMNLTQRLSVMRRANRHASSKRVSFRLSGEDVDIDAQTVNVSSCGTCLKISNPLKRGQVLHCSQAETEEGILQWEKKLKDGWCLAGDIRCVKCARFSMTSRTHQFTAQGGGNSYGSIKDG